MTPTEQDKGLREGIISILRDSKLDIVDDADDIMQLFTADRKRVALEARIDELKKVDMLTKPLLPNSGSVETSIKAWVKDRLPYLKAQQEKE